MPTREEFLVRVMHHLGTRLKEHLVLKGGMLLRLYNSPRSTQDIDYILLSEESKKILVGQIREALKEIPYLVIRKEELNSRGIWIDVEESSSKTRALIEVSVQPSTELPPEPLSTASLSTQYSIPAVIISTMALPEAFSHKIAACVEREATRDLYDMSLLEPQTHFDKNTLIKRFSSLAIKKSKPRKIDFQEAAGILRQRLTDLTEERLRQDVYPLIPKTHREGLFKIIQASVLRVIQKIETLGL